jgi:hypothetical protein
MENTLNFAENGYNLNVEGAKEEKKNKKRRKFNLLGLGNISEGVKRAVNLHKDLNPTPEMLERENEEFKSLSVLGGGTLGLMWLFGSAIASNGLTLAILTSAGFGMLIIKMPKWFSHILMEFDLLVDSLITLIMFYSYGASVTGLIASGMTCILVSICLKWNRLRIYRECAKRNGNRN